MAKQFSRLDRIGDQLQRELALLIQREVKDPRLGLVTITAVNVTRDLGHAKVFYTVMGKENTDDISLNQEVLEHVSGFLRSQLGKAMKLRTIPQLHFVYDESVRRGSDLSALIDKALAEDRKYQQEEQE